MNSPKFLRKVNYRRLLDKNAPISSYDLYEGESHRFAFLHFYNNSLNLISAFKVKFDFYDENKNLISTCYEKIKPVDFISHGNYDLKSPLVMPLTAQGFNYEIFDVEFVSKGNAPTQRIKLQFLPVEEEGKYIKAAHKSKKTALFISLASILLACLGGVAYWIRGSVIGAIGSGGSNMGDINDGITINGDFGLTYRYENGGLSIIGFDNSTDYVELRDSYDGYSVKKIDFSIFQGNTNIRSLYFECKEMMINNKDFADCTSLEAIRGRIGFIDSYAFINCTSLYSVQFEYCQTIAPSAFFGCNKLEKVIVNSDCKVSQDSFPENVKVVRQ